MKYILGLTGPTGSGKTTACKVAEQLGFESINCDMLARQATENTDTLDALTLAFGSEILDDNKKLNRRKLAEKAFSSKENTELLNATVLPFILKLIKKEIENSAAVKILLDAPTLYESGADALCHDVCAVLSNTDNRKKRIIERDNISLEAAELRLNAGQSDEYYKDKTPHIIYNDGDKETFAQEFESLLRHLGGN